MLSIALVILLLVETVLLVKYKRRCLSLARDLWANWEAMARLVERVSRAAAAAKENVTKVYALPPETDTLIDAVRPLVLQAMEFDPSTSGVYKRDWVFRTFTKAHPDASHTALHHAISFAYAEEAAKN